jgi:hypothetical protein
MTNLRPGDEDLGVDPAHDWYVRLAGLVGTAACCCRPKGSAALEATVRAYGGQVWKLDGKLPADLLDPRPHQVSDLLLEAEDYSLDARVFRDAAHQRALWAAWALALQGKPLGLAELRRLLDREASRGGAGAVPTRFAGE